MSGIESLSLFSGLIVFFLSIPAFLMLRKQPQRPVIASVKHEIESLMAIPPAFYGPMELERRVSKEEQQPLADEGVEKSLIRLQERYSAQADQLSRLESMIREGQKQQTDALKELATAFNNAFQKASTEYVTKQEFGTVKAIVYATVSLICAGFVGALIAQVMRSQGS